MSGFKDISGQRFGRLIALRDVGRTPGRGVIWECRCDCGAVKPITGHVLRRKTTVSCGCQKRDDTIERQSVHGCSGNKCASEYSIWAKIIQRCENPNCRNYHRYGGRGIRICARWRSSFVDFICDVGARPSARHSLDRIDNDGNYEPGNCRWATRSEQNNNTVRNVFISIEGTTLTIGQAAKKYGLAYSTLKKRLASGLSPEVAVRLPLGATRRLVSLAETAKARADVVIDLTQPAAFEVA